jgi:hypothetical protein
MGTHLHIHTTQGKQRRNAIDNVEQHIADRSYRQQSADRVGYICQLQIKRSLKEVPGLLFTSVRRRVKAKYKARRVSNAETSPEVIVVPHEGRISNFLLTSIRLK